MPRFIQFPPIPGLLLLAILVPCRLDAAGSPCPTPAPRPEVPQSALPTQPGTLEPYSITRTVAHYYEAPLGLGYLEVIEDKDQNYYDWMFEIKLPLWHTPDAARPLGWLLQGRIHADGDVQSLTGAGMVETDYEHTSFIVWDTQDEWLKLAMTKDLYAWTHRCHLEKAAPRLGLVPWQAFFRKHADWLHFRRPVPHILRKSPGLGSQRVTTIGLDHKLVLLDIHGDWMKVDVEQPDLTCRGPDTGDRPSIRHRGWIKWRDEQGPWVYVYTRGC